MSTGGSRPGSGSGNSICAPAAVNRASRLNGIRGRTGKKGRRIRNSEACKLSFYKHGFRKIPIFIPILVGHPETKSARVFGNFDMLVIAEYLYVSGVIAKSVCSIPVHAYLRHFNPLIGI